MTKKIPIHDNKYKEELHNCHHTPQTGPDCISDVICVGVHVRCCLQYMNLYTWRVFTGGRFFIGQVNQQKIHAKIILELKVTFFY